MQHFVTTSADGSSTLQLTEFGEAYHSTNGAFTEAMHIYIGCGVEHLWCTQSVPVVNVFDVGLGTGLNCILVWAWQQMLRLKGLPYPKIVYWGIEKFPVAFCDIERLNYPFIIGQHSAAISNSLTEVFHFMHRCPWEEDVDVSEGFVLHKCCADIAQLGAEFFRGAVGPSVVFYDTFSPATQPELWDEAIFRSIADGCASGSVLVTYCSKGNVKQALRNAGFSLERLAGPPGKRHIIRGRL